MDKEILIDGVDVSECSYAITPKRQCPNKPMPYAKETSCISCKEHNTKLNFCKNNPDCYFKQLKRLEQENEKLKQVANDSIIEQEKLISKVNELQAENEQIKKDYAKLHIDFAKCNEENERLKEVKDWTHDNLRMALYDKEFYKQALQEIRDMVTLFHSVNENKDLDRFKNNILAKINEVIGAVE